MSDPGTSVGGMIASLEHDLETANLIETGHL
jgi:hypothetical protein